MFDEKTLRLHGLMLRMPDENSLSLLQSLSTEQSWMRVGLDELAQTPLGHWQGEYIRLFINGLPNTAAPPYESVYRQATISGPVVDELHALYADAGLTIGEMPADYLGTQLEFAAHLAASDHHEHLQHWLPKFTADLCQQSRLLIYRLWGGQLTLLTTHMQEQLACG
ncbi:MAG: molecular chaperone TorD family protein [Candidatus Thiodiazotropha sp.]